MSDIIITPDDKEVKINEPKQAEIITAVQKENSK